MTAPSKKTAVLPAIELRGVSFSYNGAPALEDVDLAIAEGELVSIVGPNGGGKSTMLKLILGLLRPDRGEVLLFGDRPARGRARAGYVPQFVNYDELFPVSALDVTLMGRLGRPGVLGALGRYTKADRKAAMDALEQVEMDKLRGRHFADLSGGERQRVLIARALASEPRLMLLDEPTANVDMEAERRLSALIGELAKRMTIVLVSHNPLLVTSLVEHVVCVNRRVLIHPTSELSDEGLAGLYGGDMRIVRHGQNCPAGEHSHD